MIDITEVGPGFGTGPTLFLAKRRVRVLLADKRVTQSRLPGPRPNGSGRIPNGQRAKLGGVFRQRKAEE